MFLNFEHVTIAVLNCHQAIASQNTVVMTNSTDPAQTAPSGAV